MFPALPLLLLPCRLAHRCFSRYVCFMTAIVVNLAIAIIRFVFGTKVVAHVRGGTRGLRELFEDTGDLLIVCNHRTILDWAFFWCLASTVGRIRNHKIVVMWWFRMIPGIGWASQCIEYAFMKGGGRNTQGDLDKLSRTIAAHDPSIPLTCLLFPEGHDLTKKNIAHSNRFADQQDPPLPHYTQVLHPRTGAFVQCWPAISQRRPAAALGKTKLLDMTMAYVDYVPGEIPNPLSMFILGRRPSEVHILVEDVDVRADINAQGLESLCKQLFATKERRLKKFYDRTSQENGNGRVGDVSALTDGSADLEQVTILSSLSHLIASSLFCIFCVGAVIWSCFVVDRAALYILSYIICTGVIYMLMGHFGGVDGFIQRHEARERSRGVLATPLRD